MFSYCAYGLGIDSAFELPELVPATCSPDLLVEQGESSPPALEFDRFGHGFAAANGSLWYYFKDAGTYRIRSGREIVVDSLPGAAEQVVRLSLLGPAMSLALLQRRRVVLHASCIGIDGRAVAFAGGNSWGKSTMAAMLLRRGHRFVSDDVTAVALDGEQAMVVPSFPQLKLWPDAAGILGDRAASHPRLHPDVDKVGVAIEGFDTAPVPLTHLYVLGRGAQLEVQPMPPQLALRALIVHWYGTRFGPGFLASLNRSDHFLQCVELARRVNVRTFFRPSVDVRDAGSAREIERVVLADLRQSCSGGQVCS